MAGERANGGPPAPRGVNLSLATKGLVFIGGVTLYAVMVAWYVSWEEKRLLDAFDGTVKERQADRRRHEMEMGGMERLELRLSATLATATDAEPQAPVVFDEAALREMDNLLKPAPEEYHPLAQALKSAREEPVRAQVEALIKSLKEERAARRRHEIRAAAQEDAARDFWERSLWTLTARAGLAAAVGILASVAALTLFFSRLTRDLMILERSARCVLDLQDYRSCELVRRGDEVGELALVIEEVAAEMRQQQARSDIERKKLFHQDKMAAIGMLAAGIAHEVGNPIAAITAVLDKTLKDQVKTPCPNLACREGLLFILEHTERLASITREVTQFSMPQSAKPQLMDLNGVVRNTANLMKYDRRLKSIDINLDLDSQIPAVRGREDQITQALMNLLINAADAVGETPDRHPSINVSTLRQGEMVEIKVRDNGKGMDRETMDRAFEAFFTTKPAGKGTGLGLSLAHSIITEHKGKIEIESAESSGTLVRMILPIG
ncbi:MAG: GHKL domain-containing protein [Nitrospinae bacterium]|nr:GHKL domain-containing protein [Nitrospinota bacterium]